jgi:bifunctional oligoribonuclease and PAP phosphatase NrnA
VVVISRDIIRQIEGIINNSQKILLVAHKNPDGDTLGSVTGWYEVLSGRGKMCTIACVDKAPEPLSFLEHSNKIVHEFNIYDYDSIIICDAAARDMAGFNDVYPELYNGSTGIPVINIDHHGTNDRYGVVNLVCTDAASTTSLITQILINLSWKINPKAATCFLTGIYTDTGSFMHSNTDVFTLRMASQLIARGANIRSIRQNIFKTTKISTLQLWGRVLQNMYKNNDGITVSIVTEEDFQETGADFSELTGVIDYVNSVPNTNFSLMLTQKDGLVKGSMRTLNDNVDLSEIAGKFGGGGHKRAAGFVVPGTLKKEVRWTVV